MLPLSLDIRYRSQTPPRAVVYLILGMLVIHLLVAMAPDDWQWANLALNVNDPLPTQFVTAMFSHGSFGHWFWNSFFLFVFGRPLEDRLGTRRFLLLFVLVGLGSNLLYWGGWSLMQVIDGHETKVRMLGASGAISGIIGLSALRFRKARILMGLDIILPVPWLRFRMPVGLLTLFYVLKDLVGLVIDDHVAHGGHLGGFFMGWACAAAFSIAQDGKDEVLWDEARAHMERGSWIPGLALLDRVAAMRPLDPDVQEDRVTALLKLVPPNPEQDSPWRRQAAAVDKGVSLHVLQGHPAAGMELFRRSLPPLRQADLAPKTVMLLRPHLGMQPTGAGLAEDRKAPLDADDRQRVVAGLLQALDESYRARRLGEAAALARRLGQLRDHSLWPPEALTQAFEASFAGQSAGWEDLAQEVLRAQVDAVWGVRALRALGSVWVGTPKQGRLDDLLKQARARWPELAEDEGLAEMKARMEKA